MAHKYGIYQSSSKSCVFYKQDEDGKQSTFNIFLKPSKESKDRNDLIAFIDNEEMKKDNWAPSENINIKDILEAFGGWAADAPIVFELEAQKSLSQCLSSVLKKEL
jgi:hypothetical protein